MTDLRKFKSRRDIQAGFIACLGDQPFAAVTVNDICAAALVGRSTFYHHYADKYALLAEMVTERADTFDRLLDSRVAGVADDEPLLTLYRQLEGDADAITRLLAIHERDGDLRARYLTSLARHAEALLPQVALSIPKDFALELYATTALTAISWSLRHGEPAAISRFMNRLVKMVLSTSA
ncbi:TetR/AcrR family transcriptional regulator [Lacticaseibacillus kribbianus]|uniref:TetR/AcrR family transcriptional regulator n=1 Tax=Lacticaseibacillus kribbianus TaxID=2926292 RepID=UPI001CD269BC|nr:TetR/AcrR family transcriptional regulator [Lacticaseibacillus kribbianus]